MSKKSKSEQPKDDELIINEGLVKKGGKNKPPTKERPEPPKGQGKPSKSQDKNDTGNNKS